MSEKSCTFAQNYQVRTTVERQSSDSRATVIHRNKAGYTQELTPNFSNTMSQVITSSGIDTIRGKTEGRSRGYFYQSKITGKTFYRERDETYQQNQSPRQKWNSAAFRYANAQLKQIITPEAKAKMQTDFETANHLASNGKSYATARAWKFNSLLYEYKQAHPFDGGHE